MENTSLTQIEIEALEKTIEATQQSNTSYGIYHLLEERARKLDHPEFSIDADISAGTRNNWPEGLPVGRRESYRGEEAGKTQGTIMEETPGVGTIIRPRISHETKQKGHGMTQQEYPRHLRLLSQYAADRIDDQLSQNNPPRDIYDMTTWRLERPDNLLEVVEGILADPCFREKWPTWKVFKKTLTEVAMPAWLRGQQAYQRASIKGIAPEKLKGMLDDDPADFGMRVALNTERGQSNQMWFYEGWLTALDEEEAK